MIRGLELHRRQVADGFEETVLVEPGDPLEHRELNVLGGSPGTARPDHFRLDQADDRFGQCVVIRIATAANRDLDGSFGQPFGVADRKVLGASIRMVNQPVEVGPTIVNRLFQGIESQVAAVRVNDFETVSFCI